MGDLVAGGFRLRWKSSKSRRGVESWVELSAGGGDVRR